MKIIIFLVIAAVGGFFMWFHAPRSLPQSTYIVTPSQTVMISASPLPVHTVGQITRHASNFIGQTVEVSGYVLSKAKTYTIFSDENGGALGVYDLPVTGPGIDQLVLKNKYILQGEFISGGLDASNKNPNHLELLTPPQLIK